MNSNVYVFGKFGKTFTQYPDDFTRDVCIRFISEATSRSQLIIHRNNDMMHYGYVRHLDVVGQVIGFCVSMNGIMIPCIDRLYQIFEYAVSELIAGNEILTLSYDMGLTSYLESLSEKPAEVDRVAAIIQDSLLELEDEVKKLPVANIGIARNQSVRFPATESNEVIANASTQYGYTYVYKKTDFIVSHTPAVHVAPQPIPTYYVEQDDDSNNTLLYVIIALLVTLIIGLGWFFLNSM